MICYLAGFGVLDWFESVWDTMKEISIQYIVAGVFFQTIQTTLTALAWYFILAAGYPDGGVRYRDILAAYAVGVAMNGFLPANIGTFASLLMYMALIRGSTFPGILGAMTVQKIFYTAIGVFVYLYLFLSVPGSFDLQLGIVDDHRLLIPLLIVAAVVATYLVIRHFWDRIKGLWEKAKQGGAILARPRDYIVKVLLPSFGSWVAKLVVIAIFLAAYGIPVTFHTVMSVVGGNSLANTVSFTPGGVGITQAVNSVSLSSVTTTANATAYSLGQQLIVTAWNVLFGDGARDLGVRLDGREAARRARRTPARRRRQPSSRRPTRPARPRRRRRSRRQAGRARRRARRLSPQVGSTRSVAEHSEHLGHRPRLERAARRGVRCGPVRGLGDRAEAPLRQVRLEPVEEPRDRDADARARRPRTARSARARPCPRGRQRRVLPTEPR